MIPASSPLCHPCASQFALLIVVHNHRKGVYLPNLIQGERLLVNLTGRDGEENANCRHFHANRKLHQVCQCTWDLKPFQRCFRAFHVGVRRKCESSDARIKDHPVGEGLRVNGRENNNNPAAKRPEVGKIHSAIKHQLSRINLAALYCICFDMYNTYLRESSISKSP